MAAAATKQAPPRGASTEPFILSCGIVDYYTLLGVDDFAEPAEIKQAYRTLAKACAARRHRPHAQPPRARSTRRTRPLRAQAFDHDQVPFRLCRCATWTLLAIPRPTATCASCSTRCGPLMAALNVCQGLARLNMFACLMPVRSCSRGRLCDSRGRRF